MILEVALLNVREERLTSSIPFQPLSILNWCSVIQLHEAKLIGHQRLLPQPRQYLGNNLIQQIIVGGGAQLSDHR